MGLATLRNTPLDEIQLSVFAFANANEHLKIADNIFRVFDVQTDLEVLDPIPFHDINGWLFRHQRVHDEQNAVLGIVSNDLTDLNFEDRAQLADWVRLHFESHRQAAEALQLT